MKLIISGLTSSAAQMRSPSFSRFSSSATTISLPASMSAIACLTVPKFMIPLMLQRKIGLRIQRRPLAKVGLQESPHMFSDYVRLYVHPRSRLQITQRRMTQGVLDQRKLQTARLQLVHGEADPVDGDRPVKHKKRLDRLWHRKVDEQRISAALDRGHDTDTVHVTLHD